MNNRNSLLFLKKKYVTALILFIVVLISNGAFCQPYPYRFKYLTVDEGLSHTDANYIAEDKLGYIWVATNFGLDRYDGYTIKKYYNNNIPLNNASKNRILCDFADDNGNIWLGTEDGLQCFDPKKEKYFDFNLSGTRTNPIFSKIYKPAGNYIYGLVNNKIKLYHINGHNFEEQKLNTPNVKYLDMLPDKKGVLYFGSNKGVWCLDKNNAIKPVAIIGLTDQNTQHLHFNGNNELLIATKNKLLLTNKAADKKLIISKQYTCTGNNSILEITSDNKNNYWLIVNSSLVRLDSNLNFIQTVSNKTPLSGLNASALYRVFVNRSQCLWICTGGGGVNYCDLNQKLFYTLQHDPGNSNSLSGNHIRSVLVDGENLWIGTNANGLNRYNLNSQKFTFYNSYNTPLKLKNDVILALMLDNEHNLWIGGANGIDILSTNGQQLIHPKGYANFPTFEIETIAKDCFGNIWFGNHYNFGVLYKDKQSSYHVKLYKEGQFILPDKIKPLLFVSSRHGLKQIIIDNEGNIKSQVNYTASSKPNSLTSSYISPVSKQNDSTYWVGTMGGGLNKLVLKNNAYTIRAFAGNYGIFNDVESIETDNRGNIWLGGNYLDCLNPTTGKVIKYDKSDGLQGNSFKVRASYKGSDGRLYFGGINGLNYFYPDQIKPNTIAAKPVLTDILINNKKPEYNNPDSSTNSLPNTIGYEKSLSLNYLQNNFVIFFSAMHFANALKCNYRYKLVGFDKDWRYTDGENPSASYNNLYYKDYTFIVEASNNDGIWGVNHAELSITITPPWWKSRLAKVIYLLLFLSVLAAIYIYQARWYRLKREIEVRAFNEKKREEMHLQREEMHKQREELYQQQLTFFTNISHEFRTPLTLILGPLENLISNNKDSIIDNSYQLMFRNAKRLLNLISELMNFKKVSDSLIKLQVQPLIIDQFCENMAQEFRTLATDKEIDFNLTIHQKKSGTLPIKGTFDTQILEKILFNLLNNAFKYTNSGGKVSFDLFFDINKFKPTFSAGFKLLNEHHRAKTYCYFRVADTGIGISNDSITRIFDRYYRISKEHLGSGVGLALVKSLTQLHKGDIYVYSDRNQGTEIIIGIPFNEADYTDFEKAPAGTDLETQLEFVDNSILSPAKAQAKPDVLLPKINKHILIVDDNLELRVFLKQIFENNYHVYEAADAYAAIDIATQKTPDLIISDVMMPGMDGIELCSVLKNKAETKHIPFIILSAKDALASKIEGLESGADFYFAKPLSVELLLLTVNNIFEHGEKIKQQYTTDYLSEATANLHSEKDREFVNRLINLIEDNINDPVLDIDFLCKHLYVSRTKLYQQVKNIAGQPVGDFIRNIRLKKAVQLMTHEDLTMTEVADRIGLQSGSNFSRSFKKEYGKSPLQFIQSLKKVEMLETEA